MTKKIRFIFKEDGTTEVDANGFKGNECVKLTDELLKGLEGKLKQRKIKEEFYVYEKTKSRAVVQG